MKKASQGYCSSSKKEDEKTIKGIKEISERISNIKKSIDIMCDRALGEGVYRENLENLIRATQNPAFKMAEKDKQNKKIFKAGISAAKKCAAYATKNKFYRLTKTVFDSQTRYADIFIKRYFEHIINCPGNPVSSQESSDKNLY